MSRKAQMYNPNQGVLEFDKRPTAGDENEIIEPDQALNIIEALDLACKASQKKALIDAAKGQHPGVNNKYYRPGAVEYQKRSRKEIIGEYSDTLSRSIGSRALKMVMAESALNPNLPEDEYAKSLPKAFYFEFTGPDNEAKRRKIRKELKKYIKPENEKSE
jgi:hypothetical protein